MKLEENKKPSLLKAFHNRDFNVWLLAIGFFDKDIGLVSEISGLVSGISFSILDIDNAKMLITDQPIYRITNEVDVEYLLHAE